MSRDELVEVDVRTFHSVAWTAGVPEWGATMEKVIRWWRNYREMGIRLRVQTCRGQVCVRDHWVGGVVAGRWRGACDKYLYTMED